MKARPIYALIASVCIPSGLWGAFGSFDGSGSSLHRYGPGDIQLVSEDVIVKLKPVEPSSSAADYAIYTCQYRLKNLEDKALTVEVGIPSNNPEVQEFVKVQDWYPVENPPPLDPSLKEALLRLHQREAAR